VVFFLGGCTYTEIAALRWAGGQTQGEFNHLLCVVLVNLLSGRKFLIATTGMANGGSMIESIAGVGRAAASSNEANL
jgi:vacuolar protein sorting-associated protein 33A